MKHLLVMTAVATLAACQSSPAANNQADASPETNNSATAQESDVDAAQRLVRAQVAERGAVSFAAPPQTGTRQGVTVVCGKYSQSGREHRYIVVNREDVFVEPEMRPGEMPRAVAEFCGDGERG
jgi:hypothetical protein